MKVHSTTVPSYTYYHACHFVCLGIQYSVCDGLDYVVYAKVIVRLVIETICLYLDT